MRCLSWSAHCSRLLFTTIGCLGRFGILRPLRCWPLSLLPVLAYRNDTERTSLVTVAGTGLTLVMLIGVVTRPRSAVGSLLASGPMRWLGERSYSIYLWNVLARIAILNALGHTVVGDIAWIAMFVVLAEASFRFVERPLRARFARRSGVPRTRSDRHPTADAPAATHTPPPPPPAKPDADTSPVAATDPPERQYAAQHNGSPSNAGSAAHTPNASATSPTPITGTHRQHAPIPLLHAELLGGKDRQ